MKLKKTYNLTLTALFAVIIVICSWLQLPAAVPFTLQTFAVFLSLCLLGGKMGLGAIGVYILLGAAGLPVFHGFTGGVGILFGSTGGYIFGFIVTGVIYLLITKKASEKPLAKAAALAIGLIACYICGTLWYAFVAGNESGLAAAALTCVVPFIVPDIIKLTLALFLSERLKKHIKISR